MTRLWTFVLSIAINLLALAVPLALLHVYDRILPNQSIGTAYVIFSVAAVSVVVAAFLRYVRSASLARSGAEAEYRLWMRVVHGAFSDPATRSLKPEHREILFTSPARAQDALVGQSMLPIFDAPFGLVFVWLVWFLGGPLVLAPLGVAALAIVIIMTSAGAHPEALKTELHREGRVSAVFAALARTGGGALIKGVSAQLYAMLYRERGTMAAAQARLDRMDGLLTDVTQSASLFVMLLLLGFGAGQVLSGDLTSGGLAACTLLGSRGTLQLVGLASALVRRQRAKVAYDELERLIETETVEERREAPALGMPLGVELELDGHLASIAPGEIVAVQAGGAVASGRALKHMVDSLWKERASVSLRLGGRAVRFADVERSVRFLAAQPDLIDGSLLDNITRFDPSLTEEAMALSRMIGLDAGVARLPHGYQTLCGPSQTTVTPGMASRAAIIQVLVGGPGLVLLQRPAIGLDIAGVQALAETLSAQAGHKTIIMATERAELIAIAGQTLTFSTPEQIAAEEVVA
ncbi:hypothetical protein [Salipiger bermudensis]|uniref:Toxin secretion ABC transporter protein, HlyB family n=1 Tax=Salipiger bermudensis (strain DSM 26914 / JCM 13377 / KCTC 12554 / HTCC2601) TaxID=314265 RepID=Q0FTY9_SALBH|nr:hypothetical protein [Salipiger bermudensis]EAU47610.1 toxin secretion ABC transporter protein, HlyB family [Salipiger bermudensis HTCC2601]